jgi:hypothetical protein
VVNDGPKVWILSLIGGLLGTGAGSVRAEAIGEVKEAYLSPLGFFPGSAGKVAKFAPGNLTGIRDVFESHDDKWVTVQFGNQLSLALKDTAVTGGWTSEQPAKGLAVKGCSNRLATLLYAMGGRVAGAPRIVTPAGGKPGDPGVCTFSGTPVSLSWIYLDPVLLHGKVNPPAGGTAGAPLFRLSAMWGSRDPQSARMRPQLQRRLRQSRRSRTTTSSAREKSPES